MGEFFNGWRRRLGVVTLVLACVVTFSWIRTLHHGDSLDVSAFGAWHSLGSESGKLSWWKLTDTLSNRGWPPHIKFISKTNFSHYRAYIWRDHILELRSIHQAQTIPDATEWAIPYWSIVIPLTLLSAWLLLAKPRPTSPNKFADPAPMSRA